MVGLDEYDILAVDHLGSPNHPFAFQDQLVPSEYPGCLWASAQMIHSSYIVTSVEKLLKNRGFLTFLLIHVIHRIFTPSVNRSGQTRGFERMQMNGMKFFHVWRKSERGRGDAERIYPFGEEGGGSMYIGCQDGWALDLLLVAEVEIGGAIAVNSRGLLVAEALCLDVASVVEADGRAVEALCRRTA